MQDYIVADGSLHTMVVLQAYQANLLKDSDLNEGVSLDAFLGLP